MFASREGAGRELGRHLVERGMHCDLVLGLPRGGVVVAAEVAHSLKCPLDVVIVRKIGHPLQREFAVGALAEGDVIVLDEVSIGRNPLFHAQLNYVIEEEQERLRDYQAKFHAAAAPDPAGRSVLLVDDGLATGATMEAAVLSLRKRNARDVTVAVPVASTNALQRLAKVADGVEALVVDADFDAVGRYYQEFTQTTDEEVLDLLRAEGNVIRDS